MRTVAYCEIDPYARAVLLSRMADGGLRPAPIWDDVRTLRGDAVPPIDIVYGGFPCQDLSLAGSRRGLDGGRSGLYAEIVRLAEETRPALVFLENVPPAHQYFDRIESDFGRLGFELRPGYLSASDVGAPHIRKRWWCLAAHPQRLLLRDEPGRLRGKDGQSAAVVTDDGRQGTLADAARERCFELWPKQSRDAASILSSQAMADADGLREPQQEGQFADQRRRFGDGGNEDLSFYWAVEPAVGRVANGIPSRVDRLRALGNAVVPAQAREAFRRLSGL